MPHLDDIRQIYGTIFVRRGLYKNGIFRFKIILPTTYNSLGSTPQIIFTPPIFNPLVDKKVFTQISSQLPHLPTSGSQTGALSLVSDENLREWNPKKHILNSALVFLKKIFYMKAFHEIEYVANEEARQL
jgi:ubiquitin-protein ligase